VRAPYSVFDLRVQGRKPRKAYEYWELMFSILTTQVENAVDGGPRPQQAMMTPVSRQSIPPRKEKQRLKENDRRSSPFHSYFAVGVLIDEGFQHRRDLLLLRAREL